MSGSKSSTSNSLGQRLQGQPLNKDRQKRGWRTMKVISEGGGGQMHQKKMHLQVCSYKGSYLPVLG